MIKKVLKKSGIINEVSECPKCGSGHIVRKGRVFHKHGYNYKYRYQCKDCKKTFTGIRRILHEEEVRQQYEYQNKEIPKRDWASYNEYQTNEKEMTMNIINDLLNYVPIEVKQKTGRPTMNPREIIFCMLYKVYYQLSSRRLVSDLKLAEKIGYISMTPCYSTIMNYFNDNRFKIILNNLLTLSSSPINCFELDTAIDSSGFSTSKFGHWSEHKWGKASSDRRMFRKAHILVDVKTNIILSANVTDQQGENSSDSRNFAPLLKKSVMNFRIKEISADAAYSSRDNYDYANKHGVMAFIPFKKNTTGAARGSYLWRRMYNMFRKDPNKFYNYYHKRSNVETTFAMIKQKFGGSLMTKNLKANINEIFCKLVCHNISCLVKAFFTEGVQIKF